jgi:hypothetical protein
VSAYQQKVSEIVANAKQYHEAFYQAKTFGGPRLYFHQKAINTNGIEFTHRLEYIYATLAAWGMHRMGKGGSKMLPFPDFQVSVIPLRGLISEVARIRPSEIAKTEWAKIETLFKGIKVMASSTSIVGNSKVMAHLVPNIVPPIDRE